MGRRKIEIKKIESKDRLMVTFSKRRAGLFKKAQQLSQLSGATIAVLVFSPAGKPFTFSSGGNFDETIASFQGGQVPESTSQPLWWETDLSSQPTGNPCTSSSDGNFDETFDSFLGDQVPEFTSQPLWWETNLSPNPPGTLSPPLLVETLMRRLLLFREVKSRIHIPTSVVGNRFELPTHRNPFTSSSGGNFDETIASSRRSSQNPHPNLCGSQVPESTSQPLWWETDLSSQSTGNPFTSSSGGNFDETIDSFLGVKSQNSHPNLCGSQVPESTSQPLWWETDLSSQPTRNPFISSSGGNFDETIASFQGGQVPESKSQPLWWEADLSRIADLDQLQACKESLLKLRENVLERIQQLQHPEM
ncbi:MADS-box protein flowering locus C [Vitis vinifera]|uniref:MADS-box protein flowering locus C n=1 Tax=Vitis vinifera TaxID=29760 RepID=A0A438GVJ6_VITVI|nr:MADS-box protein flowering locus C [Vitis vinifera]